MAVKRISLDYKAKIREKTAVGRILLMTDADGTLQDSYMSLSTIRNGLLLSKEFVCTPSSKLKLNILKVLQEEGYITSFKENEILKGIKEI